MDSLLSQLKGQGSPFTSPQPNSQPNSNTVKLLDTIHLLSQATLLVAQQLQERNPPAPTYLPTPLLTPKSSPVSSAKKTPPPKPTLTSVLSWVPRAPEYYRPSPPNPSSGTHTSVPTPSKPTLRTPHTKKDRKPKSKRTNPSTQPNPSPNPPTTPATPRPALPDQRKPLAPPTPSPTYGSVQTDQCEPPNPLPTPTPSAPRPAQTDQRDPAADRMAAKRRAKNKQRMAASSKPKPSTPTPPPTHQDDVAPLAPANDIVTFPHPYEDCPRLPECPAHKARFEVSCQAYVARKRDTPLPPLFPQPFESGFELRAERDTAWWPVPPSDSSSPPGSPVDPEETFLNNTNSYL